VCRKTVRKRTSQAHQPSICLSLFFAFCLTICLFICLPSFLVFLSKGYYATPFTTDTGIATRSYLSVYPFLILSIYFSFCLYFETLLCNTFYNTHRNSDQILVFAYPFLVYPFSYPSAYPFSLPISFKRLLCDPFYNRHRNSNQRIEKG